MNHLYHVVWSHAKQLWVVGSELTKSKGKSKSQTQQQNPTSAGNNLAASLLLIATSSIAMPSYAADVTWDDGVTGNWELGTNWDIDTVPTNTDNVRIDNGVITINSAVNSYLTFIGDEPGTTGAITVDGAGSNWTNTFNLFVGEAGDGSLTINNGGTVSNMTGFIGYVSGVTGTVTVDGAGSSWINSSSIKVGNSGDGTLTISNGGAVIVDSGNGTISVANFGASTGTLNIGAAQGDTAVAAGSLSAATLDFRSGTGGRLVLNHTDTGYDFSADITDTGAIDLYSGTTSFSGDLSAYTGTMTVDGGTLSIAEGDTLSLGGNYTQTSSGTLKIGASSTSNHAQLAVVGTATFAADSAIEVDVNTVNSLADSDTLADVVTAGTLSASTFSVSDNSALFDFTATVDGNTVDLNVAADSSSNIVDIVNSEQLTPGIAAAQVLNGFIVGGTTGGDTDTVVTALGQLATDKEVAEAVAETLPLLVSGTTQVARNNMHGTSRVVQARLSGLSAGDGFITDKHLWLKPIGSWTQQDERNNVSGYDAESYGFVGGIDGDLNDSTKLGFAFSYINTNVDGRDMATGNSVDVDAYQAIVYGSKVLAGGSDLELNWQADMGINQTKGKRAITFMNRVAESDYDSYTAHVGVGIAKTIVMNESTTLVPSIRADYAYIREESYSETGAGALNLNVDSNSAEELMLMAQANLSHKVNDNTQLLANAGVGYDILNGTTSLTSSYAGGGAAFTTKGIDPSPWLAKVGVGVRSQATETLAITAHYDIEGKSDFLNQTASVKFRWQF